MGKATGFKEYDRQTEAYRPVSDRINDYGEIFTGSLAAQPSPSDRAAPAAGPVTPTALASEGHGAPGSAIGCTGAGTTGKPSSGP